MNTVKCHIPERLRHTLILAFSALIDSCWQCGNREGVNLSLETAEELGLDMEQLYRSTQVGSPIPLRKEMRGKNAGKWRIIY